jgi:hypothetical protein
MPAKFLEALGGDALISCEGDALFRGSMVDAFLLRYFCRAWGMHEMILPVHLSLWANYTSSVPTYLDSGAIMYGP